MADFNCCKNPVYYKTDNELLCSTCGNTIDVEHQKEGVLNYNNRCSHYQIMGKNNKVKNIYVYETDNYKYVKFNTLFNILKNENNKQAEKLHENILKRTVTIYMKMTETKILRGNNKKECLGYILFCQCIHFNNPKTIAYIVNFMNLSKGGLSRGLKNMNILASTFDTDELTNKDEELVKLKNYSYRLLTVPKDTIAEYLIPYIIKIYNFTVNLHVYNTYRTDTKIVGCIWLMHTIKNIPIDESFFKKNKIEKTTVKKFSKNIETSIYYPYYQKILNSDLY